MTHVQTTRGSLSGLFAAVTTPVTDTGALNLATFNRHLQLLIEAGVDGVCLGGATAEYPHSELHDRRLLNRARGASTAGRCGAGKGNWRAKRASRDRAR